MAIIAVGARLTYVGRSLALNADGFEAALQVLGIDEPSLWAVMSVETGSVGGFLPDRRPALLFERHLFSRYTGGIYDATHSDISSPSPGGYGAPGAYQYTRLAEASALDEQAAQMATSWGLGQILGSNYAAAGYATVGIMVQSMIDSEGNQLRAMAKFIAGQSKIADALKVQDWATYARGYNGVNYAINHYDTRLADAHARFAAGPLPDLTVRAAQLYLKFDGMDPGPVDGLMGKKTLAAIDQWGRQRGVTATAADVVKAREV